MAIMLRTLGIPARTVSGYAEGTFDEESGLFYVAESDAHTWVEVFFPGLGWVEFEPTAAESALERPRGDEGTTATLTEEQQQAQQQSANSSENMPPSLNEQPPLSEEDQGAMSGVEFSPSTWPWWMWALLTPVVLIAGLVVLWRMRVVGPSAFTPDLPVILFERMQRWMERLGLAVLPTQTPYEQARGWRRAFPDVAQPIGEIAESYVRHRFAPQAGVQAETGMPDKIQGDGGIANAWRQLEPVFWKAWLRRLLPKRRSKGANPYDLG